MLLFAYLVPPPLLCILAGKVTEYIFSILLVGVRDIGRVLQL